MRTRANLKGYADRNFRYLLLFVIVFLTGLCIGSAIANVVSDETCREVVAPLGSGVAADAGAVWNKTFVSSMKPVVFMWAAGFTGIAVYCIMAGLLYKGGLLGYIIGVLLRVYGPWSGLSAAAASILPQNLFYIPVLFLTAAFAYQYSVGRRKNSGMKSRLRYGAVLAVGAGGCALSALADAYVTAFLMKIFVNGG